MLRTILKIIYNSVRIFKTIWKTREVEIRPNNHEAEKIL